MSRQPCRSGGGGGGCGEVVVERNVPRKGMGTGGGGGVQEKMGTGKGYEQTRMCKGGRDMGGRGR